MTRRPDGWTTAQKVLAALVTALGLLSAGVGGLVKAGTYVFATKADIKSVQDQIAKQNEATAGVNGKLDLLLIAYPIPAAKPLPDRAGASRRNPQE